LPECLECSTRNILFAAVEEGRLWMIRLDGFGSW
jgi:hypothetical protein